MTTFKVYFICSAPKAVWALGREIVIYSEVHLIILCNRKSRRGEKLYVGSIWFKQTRERERESEQREMERKRETELIPTHLKAVITSLSAWWMKRSFCNEWIEILKGESEWNWLAYCSQNNSHYGSVIAENIPADYIERICNMFSWVTHWST